MKLIATLVLLSVVHIDAHSDTDVSIDDTNIDNRASHLIESLRSCSDALQLDPPECNGFNDSDELVLQVVDILSQPRSPPTSCADIATRWPDSVPGVYMIASEHTAKTSYVYCPFTTLCGSEGWTRVAYLNMSDSSMVCPSEFELRQSDDGASRGCARKASNNPGCNGVMFSTTGVPSYSEICGRVIGYQIGTTDAVDREFIRAGHNDINSYYVDGVSITRGSPRQHVWTFMAGLHENIIYTGDGIFDCPCTTGSKQTVQSFIGNDYFCESGNPGRYMHTRFYDQALWNGKECGPIETECCRACGIPWFHRIMDSPTSDDIEMRVCCDQPTGDENVAVGLVEIYVK